MNEYASQRLQDFIKRERVIINIRECGGQGWAASSAFLLVFIISAEYCPDSERTYIEARSVALG